MQTEAGELPLQRRLARLDHVLRELHAPNLVQVTFTRLVPSYDVRGGDRVHQLRAVRASLESKTNLIGAWRIGRPADRQCYLFR